MLRLDINRYHQSVHPILLLSADDSEWSVHCKWQIAYVAGSFVVGNFGDKLSCQCLESPLFALSSVRYCQSSC
jgi:hypothetical protein